MRRSVIYPLMLQLLRKMEWRTDMGADLLHDPSRALTHIFIEKNLDLAARQVVEPALQVLQIEPVIQKTRHWGRCTDQIILRSPPDRSATVENPIIRIGPVDGLPKLHDQRDVGQQIRDAPGRIGMCQIVRRFFSRQLAGRSAANELAIPGESPMKRAEEHTTELQSLMRISHAVL